MARITGIGGVFYKVQQPQSTRDWYQNVMGVNTNEYGSSFEWRPVNHPDKRGYTQWSPFSSDTNYFGNPNQQFMINYRVDDMEGILQQLTAAGIKIVKELDVCEYGKFLHIEDPDGFVVELWEPIDEVFSQIADAKTF